VLDQIKKLKKQWNIQISAFSIQINHYHLLFQARTEGQVAKAKQIMHGGTSYQYGKKYRMKYKELWGTQKTMRVWSEQMYWKVAAYICGNLLKHHEVGTFKELESNPFSSYGYFADKCGEDFMKEGIYGIIDVEESVQGELDWEEIKQARLSRYSPV